MYFDCCFSIKVSGATPASPMSAPDCSASRMKSPTTSSGVTPLDEVVWNDREYSPALRTPISAASSGPGVVKPRECVEKAGMDASEIAAIPVDVDVVVDFTAAAAVAADDDDDGDTDEPVAWGGFKSPS